MSLHFSHLVVRTHLLGSFWKGFFFHMRKKPQTLRSSLRCGYMKV